MADLFGILAAFASGWGLFELSEFRRRWTNGRTIRRSVVAELGSVEIVLSAALVDLYKAADDLDSAVVEYLWLRDIARYPYPISETVKVASDEQIKELFRLEPKIKTWDAPDIPLPVLDGVLSGGVLGFSAREVTLLSEIKRQIYFLSYRNQVMKEYRLLLLTTKDDPEGTARIKAELNSCLNVFRNGAINTLKQVREGLKVLSNSSDPIGYLKHRFTPLWGRVMLRIARK